MKVAIVVQRYGLDVSGGAELHARYIAELLASKIDIRVFATCARDYLTWRNEYPSGLEVLNGVPVERFSVAKERDLKEFSAAQRRVFDRAHSLNEELEYLDVQGPASPSLLRRIRAVRDEFDFFLFFSLRYYQSYHGSRIIPRRSVLVPTAEREPAVALAIFQPILRGVRAILYNSPEEQALLQTLAGSTRVPGVVVGVGSKIPERVEPHRAKQKFHLVRPFIVYVGRIDPNKGCGDLFAFFELYAAGADREVDLILIGSVAMPIPEHPRIRHLGFVGDQDKFDVIAAAEALVMPSYFESLSIVALEAWALGRPVIANARCDVLVGQCLRSNAGLYYRNAEEFAGVLDVMLNDAALHKSLGDNGRTFYSAHYRWSVIEEKYLAMFDELNSSPPRYAMERLPWWHRNRPTVPPAGEILAAVPAGPVLPEA